MTLQPLLKLLNTLLTSGISGIDLHELEKYPEYVSISNKDNATYVGITEKGYHLIKQHAPDLLDKITQYKIAAAKQRLEDYKLKDWRTFYQPAEIIAAFPENPSTDDILDLYLYLKKRPSAKLEQFLDRVKKNRTHN